MLGRRMILRRLLLWICCGFALDTALAAIIVPIWPQWARPLTSAAAILVFSHAVVLPELFSPVEVPFAVRIGRILVGSTLSLLSVPLTYIAGVLGFFLGLLPMWLWIALVPSPAPGASSGLLGVPIWFVFELICFAIPGAMAGLLGLACLRLDSRFRSAARATTSLAGAVCAAILLGYMVQSPLIADLLLAEHRAIRQSIILGLAVALAALPHLILGGTDVVRANTRAPGTRSDVHRGIALTPHHERSHRA